MSVLPCAKISCRLFHLVIKLQTAITDAGAMGMIVQWRSTLLVLRGHGNGVSL